MESEIGGKTSICGQVVTDPKAVGKKTLEWDLNDWKWDGDLFLASPLDTAPLDSKSKQLFPLEPELAANRPELAANTNVFSEEISKDNEEGNREMEKRRRVVVVPDEELNDVVRPLDLKLGEQVYPIAEGEDDIREGKSVKKSKPTGTGTSQPVCQVDGCRADLSNAKDYHRRHKVCVVHSKVSEAMVGNVMQRFCQQCSRFHALQEFDEGKRSCRRRLAGHNKRRRKTFSETSLNPDSLTDERSAGYLLVSLLRILSNLPINASDESKNQDLISHLLRNLASQVSGSNMPETQQVSQGIHNGGISVRISEKNPSRVQESCQAVPSAEAQIGLSTRLNGHGTEQTQCASQPGIFHPAGSSIQAKGGVQDVYLARDKLRGIDLNNVYDDSQECIDNLEKGHGSTACAIRPEHLQKSSPPQTSGNSESTSGHSSSSGSDAQVRTDRIVFKLFGKDPNDLPHQLRTQILDWLSQSPTDIEGYIRPGCIVLTIYLRLNKSSWEELCYNMSSSLSMLLSLSNDPFWKTGWVYTRVRQHAAFICDGRVVLDTPLPFESQRSRISSISPIAVPAAETVHLVVKGYNLSGPTSRMLCAIEGKYLVHESCYSLMSNTESAAEQDDIQALSFHCSIPNVIGRGFIEVEDYGTSGCFFPFIVAEPDICSEICMLERVLEVVGTDEGIDRNCGSLDARSDALNFIHEMGWLLHRNRLRSKPGQTDFHLDLFPFGQLKWLIEFSMDRDWCAVLRILLDLLFSGIVDTGKHASVEHALSEMTLLHTAVQRNSRPMVEFLLRYIPKKVKNTECFEQKQSDLEPSSSFLFRPDVTGSNGLTPLHIATSCADFETMLDALLEDPGMVGIGAWENAQDSTGLTPKDYAYLRGHTHYIDLFFKKANKHSSGKHVVVDIHELSNLISKQKQSDKLNLVKFDNLYTEMQQVRPSCKLCEDKPRYGFRGALPTFRPVTMSLIAIAVVCVCTALLFKSMPRVGYVFEPFRWEALKYGAM